MTYSQFDPSAQNRVPWNFGAKIGPKRPFKQKQIWAIRFFFDREKRIRDRTLFDLAIDSKLRGCDLVELKIGDLVSGPEVRTRATITQRKTGRLVTELTLDPLRRSSFFDCNSRDRILEPIAQQRMTITWDQRDPVRAQGLQSCKEL